MGHDWNQCSCVVCRTKRARSATISEDKAASPLDPPDGQEIEEDDEPWEMNPLTADKKSAEPKRKPRKRGQR